MNALAIVDMSDYIFLQLCIFTSQGLRDEPSPRKVAKGRPKDDDLYARGD